MRLIDGKLLADEILGEILERGQASGLWEQQLEIGALTYADIEFANGYDKALDDVYRQISGMKTVDAIPIEWIKKWVDNIKYDNRYKSEYIELNGDITHIVYKGTEITRVPCITDMLEDWEKENEH